MTTRAAHIAHAERMLADAEAHAVTEAALLGDAKAGAAMARAALRGEAP